MTLRLLIGFGNVIIAQHNRKNNYSWISICKGAKNNSKGDEGLNLAKLIG